MREFGTIDDGWIELRERFSRENPLFDNNGQPISRPSITRDTGTEINSAQQQAPSQQSGAVQVSSVAEAQALPSGTQFIDPNGVLRVRP